MKTNSVKKEKIIAVFISACICIGVLVTVFFYSRPSANHQYRVVCLGDSILGNVRDDTSVTAVMEEQLGFEVFNGCFGGTCASLCNDANRATYYEDSMNLVSIVDAIVNKDYNNQYYDLASNNYKLPYFYDAMRDFDKVDFSSAEIIFLEHGVNDYSAGRPLDDEEDPYNTFTYGGALRYSIETLQKEFPKAKIVLVTPTFCQFFDRYGEQTGDCTTLDFGYGYLEDYANLQISIANQYGIYYIDDYHNIGIDESNVEEYTVDGIHLNEEGRALLAGVLAEFTKETIN